MTQAHRSTPRALRPLIGLGIGLGLLAAIAVAQGEAGPAYGQTIPVDDTCAVDPVFWGIASQIPGVVGWCAGAPLYDPYSGYLIQQTSGGLLVWDPTSGTAAFTDGATTWEEGPYGLEQRPNEPAG
jgi:hypothetical protein